MKRSRRTRSRSRRRLSRRSRRSRRTRRRKRAPKFPPGMLVLTDEQIKRHEAVMKNLKPRIEMKENPNKRLAKKIGLGLGGVAGLGALGYGAYKGYGKIEKKRAARKFRAKRILYEEPPETHD